MGICWGSEKKTISIVQQNEQIKHEQTLTNEDIFERYERPPNIRIPKYKVNFTESIREIKHKNIKNIKNKLYTR